MAKKNSPLYRNWGYLLLAGAIVLLFARDVGPIAVSGAFALCFAWLLFAAPTWCGAKNRGEGYCRNISSGLLGGCKKVRIHKWLRLRALIRLEPLGKAFRGWFTGAPQQIATCALAVSAISVVAGLFK